MMNGSKNNLAIPEIKRMREYHLYDFKGNRYLDMFLDGGRALLGHKPGRTVLMMKNSLEKGLSAAYPGVYPARLLKQLKMIYADITACSVVFAGRDLSALCGCEPAIYRPLEAESIPAGRIFELILPLPGSGAVRVLCADRTAAADLPVSDAVSPVILSGLCRAAAELAAFLKEADSAVWKDFDSPLWERRGPWLYPAVSADVYSRLFGSMLKRGILLSPDNKTPSCAPCRFTEGEIKPIRDIEKEFC